MRLAVTIDGSSGGGQILRNAVALSAVTGRPVRVENIRGARPRPGLRPQHLLAVEAAAEVCGAELHGAGIGSQSVEFRPGAIRSRQDWRLDVGTAGSVTLILQCLLPALAAAREASRVTLIGGTDVPFAPPFDYFAEVFAPAVRQMGVSVSARLVGRGFYPKGGGQVEVEVKPCESLAPIRWVERGSVKRIEGRSYSHGLPAHIAQRMRGAAVEALSDGSYPGAEVELEVRAKGPSVGCGIVLWAECQGGRRLGASALGERGKPAEKVGREVAQALLGELRAGGAVDGHLADQMIVWMAVAGGPSELTTTGITDHIRSAAAVAEALAGAEFRFEDGPPAFVRCTPAAGG